jgi:outer membrane protein assembly factor BamD (BamD/ComL family)
MKNAYLIIIWSFLAVFCFQCSKSPVEEVKPEILNVGASQVTVAWQSREAYKGIIFYNPTGTGAAPSSVTEKTGDSRFHEATIAGLLPGTRYSYRVGKEGKQYQFQTQPPVNSPFSFIMAYGDVSREIDSLMKSEVFDFFLSLDVLPGSGDQPDRLAAVRAYVPVFDLNGAAPVNRKSLARPGTESPGGGWKLDWAGLRLIFIRDVEMLPGLLDTPAPHTFGIVTYPGVFDGFETGKTDEGTPRANKLHAGLTAHNQANPTQPVSFVCVLGKNDSLLEVDGIRFLGIPLEKEVEPGTDGRIIRVDVDVENIRAVFTDEKREVALRTPPLQGKRTCQECRRLADKGAYEESIRAYKEFIENNQGHYQIDDAYFAIAEIYDEKLFVFNEAVNWYRRLMDEYASGTLAPLAKQRINYLMQYSQYDYKPLEQFERIRKVEFARKKDQPAEQAALLEKVEKLIKDYPDSKLAPVMLHWLANRYRLVSVPRAVELYRALKEKFPGSNESKDVAIEIGETYYQAGLYNEAVNALQQAMKELPDRKDTIASQLNRAKRNMRRDTLATVAWAAVLILLVLVVVLKPTGLDCAKIGRAVLAFVILAVVLLFAAWLIREQFASTSNWVFMALLFAFDAGLSSFLSVNFAGKVMGAKSGFAGKAGKVLVGSVMGALFFIAGFYLTVYYVNVHFLVLFKL